MRPRTTIFLFLLVAALGTFVYFWERHQQNTLERREDINLTALDPAQVDGMVLNGPGLGRMLAVSREVARLTGEIAATDLHDLVKLHEARNVAECAGALDRTESREQFFREDYPMTDPAWFCWHGIRKTADGFAFERLDFPTEGVRFPIRNTDTGLGPIGAIIRGEARPGGHA